jgi:hypothetical protein
MADEERGNGCFGGGSWFIIIIIIILLFFFIGSDWNV